MDDDGDGGFDDDDDDNDDDDVVGCYCLCSIYQLSASQLNTVIKKMYAEKKYKQVNSHTQRQIATIMFHPKFKAAEIDD